MRAAKLLLVAAAISAGSVAIATLGAPRHACTDVDDARASIAVEDPDPSSCPFCGGNPQVHVRTMFALERASMALHAAYLR